jgi:hypothetical protein
VFFQPFHYFGLVENDLKSPITIARLFLAAKNRSSR